MLGVASGVRRDRCKAGIPGYFKKGGGFYCPMTVLSGFERGRSPEATVFGLH
jgi:hypothetical protein